MARGQNKIISNNSAILINTLGREVKDSVAILNPNDGVIFVRLNGDVSTTADSGWDWKLPSQSYGLFPGPWQSLGLYFLDQSGAGRQGEVTIYDSDLKLDVPDIRSIGRALQAQATSLDITEGAQPANPAAGITRVWSPNDGSVHKLISTGVDAQLIDTSQSHTILTPLLALGAVVSKLLDGVETADTHGGDLSVAGTTFPLSSRFIITKQDASSYLLVAIQHCSIYVPSSVVQLSTILRQDDGAITYKGVGGYSSTVSGFLGGCVLLLHGVSAGTHPLQYVGVCNTSNVAIYARYASVPQYEFCRMQVWEVRSPS